MIDYVKSRVKIADFVAVKLLTHKSTGDVVYIDIRCKLRLHVNSDVLNAGRMLFCP